MPQSAQIRNLASGNPVQEAHAEMNLQVAARTELGLDRVRIMGAVVAALRTPLEPTQISFKDIFLQTARSLDNLTVGQPAAEQQRLNTARAGLEERTNAIIQSVLEGDNAMIETEFTAALAAPAGGLYGVPGLTTALEIKRIRDKYRRLRLVTRLRPILQAARGRPLNAAERTAFLQTILVPPMYPRPELRAAIGLPPTGTPGTVLMPRDPTRVNSAKANAFFASPQVQALISSIPLQEARFQAETTIEETRLTDANRELGNVLAQIDREGLTTPAHMPAIVEYLIRPTPVFPAGIAPAPSPGFLTMLTGLRTANLLGMTEQEIVQRLARVYGLQVAHLMTSPTYAVDTAAGSVNITRIVGAMQNRLVALTDNRERLRIFGTVLDTQAQALSTTVPAGTDPTPAQYDNAARIARNTIFAQPPLPSGSPFLPGTTPADRQAAFVALHPATNRPAGPTDPEIEAWLRTQVETRFLQRRHTEAVRGDAERLLDQQAAQIPYPYPAVGVVVPPAAAALRTAALDQGRDALVLGMQGLGMTMEAMSAAIQTIATNRTLTLPTGPATPLTLANINIRARELVDLQNEAERNRSRTYLNDGVTRLLNELQLPPGATLAAAQGMARVAIRRFVDSMVQNARFGTPSVPPIAGIGSSIRHVNIAQLLSQPPFDVNGIATLLAIAQPFPAGFETRNAATMENDLRTALFLFMNNPQPGTAPGTPSPLNARLTRAGNLAMVRQQMYGDIENVVRTWRTTGYTPTLAEVEVQADDTLTRAETIHGFSLDDIVAALCLTTNDRNAILEDLRNKYRALMGNVRFHRHSTDGNEEGNMLIGDHERAEIVRNLGQYERITAEMMRSMPLPTTGGVAPGGPLPGAALPNSGTPPKLNYLDGLRRIIEQPGYSPECGRFYLHFKELAGRYGISGPTTDTQMLYYAEFMYQLYTTGFTQGLQVVRTAGVAPNPLAQYAVNADPNGFENCMQALDEIRDYLGDAQRDHTERNAQNAFVAGSNDEQNLRLLSAIRLDGGELQRLLRLCAETYQTPGTGPTDPDAKRLYDILARRFNSTSPVAAAIPGATVLEEYLARSYKAILSFDTPRLRRITEILPQNVVEHQALIDSRQRYARTIGNLTKIHWFGIRRRDRNEDVQDHGNEYFRELETNVVETLRHEFPSAADRAARQVYFRNRVVELINRRRIQFANQWGTENNNQRGVRIRNYWRRHKKTRFLIGAGLAGASIATLATGGAAAMGVGLLAARSIWGGLNTAVAADAVAAGVQNRYGDGTRPRTRAEIAAMTEEQRTHYLAAQTVLAVGDKNHVPDAPFLPWTTPGDNNQLQRRTEPPVNSMFNRLQQRWFGRDVFARVRNYRQETGRELWMAYDNDSRRIIDEGVAANESLETIVANVIRRERLMADQMETIQDVNRRRNFRRLMGAGLFGAAVGGLTFGLAGGLGKLGWSAPSLPSWWPAFLGGGSTTAGTLPPSGAPSVPGGVPLGPTTVPPGTVPGIAAGPTGVPPPGVAPGVIPPGTPAPTPGVPGATVPPGVVPPGTVPGIATGPGSGSMLLTIHNPILGDPNTGLLQNLCERLGLVPTDPAYKIVAGDSTLLGLFKDPASDITGIGARGASFVDAKGITRISSTLDAVNPGDNFRITPQIINRLSTLTGRPTTAISALF